MTKAAMKEQRATLLPEDCLSALRIMTQITRQMLEFSLEEGRVLKKKDMETLARVQKGKELRAEGYVRAAKEFQMRREDFSGLDAGELDRLETMTRELGKATRDKQKLIELMAPKKPLNETYTNNLFLLQGQISEDAAE